MKANGIDFAERVEDVERLLTAEFGVTDTQLIHILLAAQLEAPGDFPWLIFETNYYSLDTSPAWFAFGNGWAASLPTLRVQKPRATNQQIEKILTAPDEPRLFVEPNWEMPVAAHYKAVMMPYLVQNCVRVRSAYPKKLPPQERRILELKELVRRALDCRFRIEPVLGRPPASLPYYAELLVKLAPGLRDWDALIRNLTCIANRIAYLFNREPAQSDWQAVVRVMRDSIPAWTKEILVTLHRAGRWHQLSPKYPDSVIKNELRRLVYNGVITSHQGRWRLRDYEAQAQDILLLLDGEVELK